MSEVLRVFIGYDPRQPISLQVLASSIYRHSSKPVAITPLVLQQLPIKRQGLTPFTYSRFLAPYLCDYDGWSLFLDADILLRDDIAKLFAMKDEKYAIMVSKNRIRFEWASVMLFNNSKCRILTPEFIEKEPKLHDISWANPNEIGNLPPEWNHLVGYDEPRADAKLIHYTQGVPAFKETWDCEHAQPWIVEHRHANFVTNWLEIMGNSVHAATLPDGSKVPLYKAVLAEKKTPENKAYAT